MYTVIIPYKILKKASFLYPFHNFLTQYYIAFWRGIYASTHDGFSWAATYPRLPNSGLTAMSNGQSIRIQASPTDGSGSKPVSFTKTGAGESVANGASATGNIPFASRRLLPKPCAQNLAQRDDDQVAFRDEHLMNPMSNLASVPTGSRINFGASSASLSQCQMTEFNACSKTT